MLAICVVCHTHARQFTRITSLNPPNHLKSGILLYFTNEDIRKEGISNIPEVIRKRNY